MDKRGQVTLFIVIAIVAVAIILFAILLTGGFKTQFTQAEITQVKGYIEDCLKLKTEDNILFIARQGGYNTLPQASINFLDEKAAYYWKDNQTLIPSTSTIADELVAYLDVHASECLKMPGYSLAATSCKSQVEIKDKVKALFDCPVTVQKGMASTQLKDFTVEVDAPIAKFLDVSSQVVEEYVQKGDNVCISCYDEIAKANNVTITLVPIVKEVAEPEHIWFLITDKDIKFDDTNVTWRFVAEL